MSRRRRDDNRGRITVRGTLWLVAGAAVLAGGGAALFDGSSSGTGRLPSAAGDASRQLASLGGASDGSSAGYNRTRDFGPAWSYDYDHNGCRQRDDVLRRDLEAVVTSNRCTVVSGRLEDPYTGRVVEFTKARADAVQIDHVFSLADAWRHGASEWPRQRRVDFANDPDNLLAVDGPTNERKGDRGPAEWMPPNAGYHCQFAITFIRVAAKYDLSITREDRAALAEALGSC